MICLLKTYPDMVQGCWLWVALFEQGLGKTTSRVPTSHSHAAFCIWLLSMKIKSPKALNLQRFGADTV